MDTTQGIMAVHVTMNIHNYCISSDSEVISTCENSFSFQELFIVLVLVAHDANIASWWVWSLLYSDVLVKH